jgi:hypothetical protein
MNAPTSSIFPTHADLTDEQLKLALDTVSDDLEKLRDEYEDIREKLVFKNSEYNSLQSQIDSRKLKAMTIPDWEFLLEETGNTSRERYKSCDKALISLAPDLFGSYKGLCVGPGTYDQDTQQRVLTVSIPKNNTGITEAVHSALITVLPFVKLTESRTENFQVKSLKIFEASLSEGGVYNLEINEEKESYKVTFTRYGRASTHKQFSNLKDLLTYISKELYY